MKKVFLIPNAITAFGLSCGLFVIFKTSVVDSDHNLFFLLQASAILLLIAGIADMADGAIARLIHAESEFGGQFDSLSDAVTFGVAPPLLMLKSLSGEELNRPLAFLVVIASMIYTLCGVLRLVRYNVQTGPKSKHFNGLPIPAAAAAGVSASLIFLSPLVMEFISLSTSMRAIILSAVYIVLGYFMVSRWKFPSVSALHFRVSSFYLVLATGVIAVLFLYGILDYFPEVFFFISWIYLIIAWTLSLIRLIAGKRSKTLVDFEPEEEE